MDNNIEDTGNPAFDTEKSRAGAVIADALFQNVPVLVNPQKEELLSAAQITQSYDQIFEMIQQKDHKGVEKLLSDHGYVVDMDPRIGCSPLHYGKFTVANWKDESGNTPLIKALYVDSRMVRVLLKYGANPNYTTNVRDTPLSIAAVIGDKHIIDALLYAGASLRAAVIKLTSDLDFISDEQLRNHSQIGYNIKPLTFLLSDDVYFKTRDPIYSAFKICKEINRIRDIRDEFELEFELIIEEAEVFTYTFLNYCDKMSEAIDVLGPPQNLLNIAIEQKMKKFISHPYCQKIVVELGYGGIAHRPFYTKVKSLILFKYIMSPFILPCLFLKFLLWDLCRGVPLMKSGFADMLRLISTPFLCFVTDAINFLVLLGSLIAACVIPHQGFSLADYFTFIAAVCRLVIEIDFLANQGVKKYFSNVWNVVDNLVVVLLISCGVYKYQAVEYAHAREHDIQEVHDDMPLVSAILEEFHVNHHVGVIRVNFIYAIAEFLLMFRILSFLEISKSFGPMLIALQHLLKDVVVFCVVLLTLILGTAISIYAMVVAMEEWNMDVESQINIIKRMDVADAPKLPSNLTIPEVFSTFPKCVKNVMWSTFGNLDVVGIESNDVIFVDYINVILILYILLSCVLLLNMLIGILSTTFDRIQENCDIEWKCSRTLKLDEYGRAQPLLFPFFVLCLPFIVWFRIQLKAERRNKFQVWQGKQSARDKINSALSDRCRMGTRSSNNTGSRPQDLSYLSNKHKKNSFALTVSAFKKLRDESANEIEEDLDADFYNQK